MQNLVNGPIKWVRFKAGGVGAGAVHRATAIVAEDAQVPPLAWAQFQCGDCRGGRMRSQVGLAHGLRGYFSGLQANLGKAGSLLLERNPRLGKPHERKRRGLDLEKVAAQAAFTSGSGGGRDLHRAGGLSGRVNGSCCPRINFSWIDGKSW